jgi:hypothetical protein
MHRRTGLPSMQAVTRPPNCLNGLASMKTITRLSQPMMVTREDVMGNGGASEGGQGRVRRGRWGQL